MPDRDGHDATVFWARVRWTDSGMQQILTFGLPLQREITLLMLANVVDVLDEGEMPAALWKLINREEPMAKSRSEALPVLAAAVPFYEVFPPDAYIDVGNGDY